MHQRGLRRRSASHVACATRTQRCKAARAALCPPPPYCCPYPCPYCTLARHFAAAYPEQRVLGFCVRELLTQRGGPCMRLLQQCLQGDSAEKCSQSAPAQPGGGGSNGSAGGEREGGQQCPLPATRRRAAEGSFWSSVPRAVVGGDALDTFRCIMLSIVLLSRRACVSFRLSAATAPRSTSASDAWSGDTRAPNREGQHCFYAVSIPIQCCRG
jgi:hypothetical protein